MTADLNGRGNDDHGRGVAVQTDGKIVIAGFSDVSIHTFTNGGNDESFSRTNDFSLARYTSAGTRDTAFGIVGTASHITPGALSDVTTDINGSDEAYGVVIQSDGKIVLGGTTDANNNSTRHFALARYDGDTATTPTTCSFFVFPTATSSIPAAGGTSSVSVSTGATCAWTAVSNTGFVTITTGQTGTGSGNVTFAVAANSSPARTGTLTVAGQTVTVTQSGPPTAVGPFGSFDTPLQGASGVAGAIPVTGWALDDNGVTAIRILFSVGTVPVATNFVGNALQVAGARTDVAAAFPAFPFKDKAGWGYMLLTNSLTKTNGTFTFSVFADDADGHSTLLGTRTITVANDTSIKPFGALDQPGQGDTISGAAFNSNGWAVTPLPKTIPTNGSTVQLFINGALIGTVAYNQFRSDIGNLFPGLNNSNGAGGSRTINTTTLTNAVHTIQWVVTDSAGVAEGIGSRFFTVQNAALVAQPTAGLRAARMAKDLDHLPAELSPLEVSTGFAEQPVVTSVRPEGGRYGLHFRNVGRLVIQLPLVPVDGGGFEGYSVLGAELQSLPVGSGLDAAQGVFRWMPGPGFHGAYDLVFVRTNSDGSRERINVRVFLEE